MTQEETDNVEDVVVGNITINELDVYALFDCGASHSFISKKFVKFLDHKPKLLNHLYRVANLI